MKLKANLLFIALALSAFSTESLACKTSYLDVSAWTYKAMLATFSFNFTNVDKGISQGKKFYDDKTWKVVKKRMVDSGLVQKVKDEKLISSVGLKNAPLLLNKTENKWKLQLPLLLVQQNAQVRNTKEEVVEVVVARDKSCQLQIVSFSAAR